MSRHDITKKDQSSDNKLISQEKTTGPDVSKRRLLKGVVGTTPVILAVSSKPVLAGWCTVSGFLSGNLSTHHDNQYCGGRSPGYWIGPNGIPKSDKTLFRNVFGGVWEDGTGLKWQIKYNGINEVGPTLRDVLAMTGNQDRYQFGAHAVAAYMNAMNSTGSYMPAAQVLQIVGEVLAFGYYTDPTTGQTLNAEQVVDFIQQTFDGG